MQQLHFHLATVLVAAAATASAAAQQASPTPPRSLFDTLGGVAPFAPERVLPAEPGDAWDALDRALAAAPASGSGGVGLMAPAFRPESPERYSINLVTGTGFAERVWVQEAVGRSPRPLLVVFHRFGVSELDAIVSTRLFEEARRRQWYVIAPRSWGGIHFSSDLSQIHTRTGLNWALSNFNIDPERIYAVGFSMGGGAALNYAATHLDPAEPRFAAVVSLSALLGHEHAYANETVPTQNAYDAIFGVPGVPGSFDPFAMRRASVLSLDPFSALPIAGADVARNLSHVHLNVQRTDQDVVYLTTQHDAFVTYLNALPLVAAQHQNAVVSFPGHSWDALDERGVCDWLRDRARVTPTAANTLADGDGAYFHFEITQELAGGFSPFSWSVDATGNAVALTATENVQRIKVHTLAAGLNPAVPLQVSVQAADLVADEVVIADWPLAPLQVLRDGQPSANWSHNPLTSELTLLETDAALHVWQLTP